MPKSLSERILIRAKEKDATRKARNFAEFLAQREPITQALADGWSVLQIWKTLHQEGTITTGYPAFCRQVNRWIRARSARAPRVQAGTFASTLTHPKPPGIGGFTYESTPNQEDLL